MRQRFKEYIKGYFLTDRQYMTNRRFIRWKRTCWTIAVVFLVFIGSRAVLGKSKVPPDQNSYNGLSDEDIQRLGVVIWKIGPIEIQKFAPKGPPGELSGGSGSSSDQNQVISRKDRARSEYSAPGGSKVYVVLEGNLNSQLPQSPVVAEVKESFSFQGRTLIPAGSKILGRSGEAQDGERISIIFDQIIYPNGHQVSAQGVAMMPDGSPGIVGELHSGRGAQIAGALGTSFIAGAASAFETTSPNIFGIQQPEGSARNAILNGVASASLDQAKRFGTEAQQTKGYVTLSAGANFVVYFEKEVDLTEVLE